MSINGSRSSVKALFLEERSGVMFFTLFMRILGFSFLTEEDLDISVKVEFFNSQYGLQSFVKFSFPCGKDECEGRIFDIKGVLCGKESFSGTHSFKVFKIEPLPCEKCNQPCSKEQVDEINSIIKNEVIDEAAGYELNAA